MHISQKFTAHVRQVPTISQARRHPKDLTVQHQHLRDESSQILGMENNSSTIRLLDSLELPPPHYRISSTEWHATHSCMKTRTLESVLESRFMMSDRLWPDFSHQSRVKQRHSGAVSPFRMQSGRNIMSPKVLMHVIIQ